LVEQIARQMKGKDNANLKKMATSIGNSMPMGVNHLETPDDIVSDESEGESKWQSAMANSKVKK
jgi:hypothetical protein